MRLFKDFYEYLAADLKAKRCFPSFETGHYEVALCEVVAQSSRTRAWAATKVAVVVCDCTNSAPFKQGLQRL